MAALGLAAAPVAVPEIAQAQQGGAGGVEPAQEQEEQEAGEQRGGGEGLVVARDVGW